MKIKTIYIASMEQMFVDCLVNNLESSHDFEIVGSSASGSDSHSAIRTLSPDLLITDLHLADLSGINLIRKIKAIGSSTKVILLVADKSPAVIHKALSVGVDGYILKYDPYSLLIEAISVIHERKFLSPGVSDPLVNSFLSFDSNPNSQKTSPLSDREEQVAKLIGDGINSKQIADMLSISEKTVSKHRGNIFKKLNISNTAQLVRYVYDNNLIG